MSGKLCPPCYREFREQRTMRRRGVRSHDPFRCPRCRRVWRWREKGSA